MPAWDKWWEERDAVSSTVEADAPTDAEGRFRLTRLAGTAYTLNCRSGNIIGPDGRAVEGPSVARGNGATTATAVLAIKLWH